MSLVKLVKDIIFLPPPGETMVPLGQIRVVFRLCLALTDFGR
jgi:hypothetical protein